MTIHNIRLVMPKCSKCNSPMHFYEEAWIEDSETAGICLVCSNTKCNHTSVIYIDLWPPNQNTMDTR